MLGVAVGVQQHHGHGLRAVGLDAVAQLGGRAIVERFEGAVGTGALRCRVAPVGRDQRRWTIDAQPVQVCPRLAAQLDQVGEALGGHQHRAGGVALQQRIGGHGHPVGELLDLVRAAAGLRERGVNRVHHALGLVVGSCGRLGGVQPSVDGDHGVGEGASDVNAQQHRLGATLATV